MANKNLYDWTSFTDNESSLDLVGHMIRWGLAPEKYRDKDTFKAVALSDSYELASNDAMAIDGGSTSPAGGAASRLAFKGRIIGDNSPHSFLPNPCDPAWPGNAESTWRTISLHTTFLDTSTTKATPVTRGDIVLVKLQRSGPAYNLEYGTFEELISIEDPTAGANEECSALVDLFGAITHTAFNVGTSSPVRTGGPPVPPGEKYSPDSPRAGLDRSKTKCGSRSKATAETEAFFSAVQPKEFDDIRQVAMFGNNNWRYQQPDLGELANFIKNKGVKRVIRLNGNSAGDLKYSYDSQTGLCVGIDLEKQFCEWLDSTVEVKKVSAHAGFKIGFGYTRSIEQCNEWFDLGDTLIHCTHGADRTGFTVAAWLKKQAEAGVEGFATLPAGGRYNGGYPGGGDATDGEALWDYTTSYNSWKTTICSNADLGYVAYLDGFYNAKDFCEFGERATTCAACKSKHFAAVWTMDHSKLSADSPEWEDMRNAGYWEWTDKAKTKWRWRFKKSGGD